MNSVSTPVTDFRTSVLFATSPDEFPTEIRPGRPPTVISPPTAPPRPPAPAIDPDSFETEIGNPSKHNLVPPPSAPPRPPGK